MSSVRSGGVDSKTGALEEVRPVDEARKLLGRVGDIGGITPRLADGTENDEA